MINPEVPVIGFNICWEEGGVGRAGHMRLSKGRAGAGAGARLSSQGAVVRGGIVVVPCNGFLLPRMVGLGMLRTDLALGSVARASVYALR